MIANLDGVASDLWVFLEEGDIELLGDEDLTGEVRDRGRPQSDPGKLEISYKTDYHGSRPSVGRMSSDGVDDIEIVMGDAPYSDLADGQAYHDSPGRYHSMPSSARIMLFPPDDRGSYSYILDEIE